jgi:hypothetical protein
VYEEQLSELNDCDLSGESEARLAEPKELIARDRLEYEEKRGEVDRAQAAMQAIKDRIANGSSADLRTQRAIVECCHDLCVRLQKQLSAESAKLNTATRTRE